MTALVVAAMASPATAGSVAAEDHDAFWLWAGVVWARFTMPAHAGHPSLALSAESSNRTGAS